MGIITKKAKVRWSNGNRKYYEELGYVFTKYGDEFYVDVSDLSKGSRSIIEYECDNCGKVFKCSYTDYNRNKKEDGKKYCSKCARELYGVEKFRQTVLSKSISFEKWCVDNDKKDLLDRWDYEKNNTTPDKVCYQSNSYFWFKCPCNKNHHSELKDIANIRNGTDRVVMCNQCNSIAQYIIDNFPDNSLEEIWDYEKNKDLDPWKIASASGMKVWIKCQETNYHGSYNIRCYCFSGGQRCSFCWNRKTHPKDSFGQYLIDEYGDLSKIWSDKNGDLDPMTLAKNTAKKVWIKCQEKDYHDSYLVTCSNFIHGTRCPYCKCLKIHPKDSFGQYLIDKYGDLSKIWSDKNGDLDPMTLAKNTLKKVWIKCQEKDYHDSYLISCNDFMQGTRCPYCAGRKVCHKDSFGQYIIDNYGEEFLWKIWSDKNDKTPFEFTPRSNKKVWMECPDKKHESFKRSCNLSTKAEYRCPKCSKTRKESYIEEKTRLYLEELGYEVKTELECSIVPKNPKTKYYLPFDNEIILENGVHLIIEVNGSQHYNYKNTIRMDNKSEERAKQAFHYQQLKDRYKRMFCKKCGYEYLELSYKYFTNDKYKEIIDNKIDIILNKTQTHIDTDIWFECLMIDNVAERMRKLSTQKNTK